MSTSRLLTIAIASISLMSLSGCLLNGSSGGGATTGAPATGGGTTGGGTTGGGTTGGGTTGGGTTGGGTTGGGTTGTGSLAAFETKALNYNFLVPTSTQLTGTADYRGEISLLTQANQAAPTEAVVGDLNMNVNFGSGVANPITATAGNFSGQVNGVQTTIGGTLSTANAIAGDPNMVTATTTAVGTLTSATATLRGTLTDPTSNLAGSARMILNGNFKEAGGAKIAGGHQTTITPSGGGGPIGTGGSLWADKR